MRSNSAAVASVILLVGWLGAASHAANILYINTVASPSHFGWNRALVYALADRGHNLTVFGVDAEKDPPANVTFILIENVYKSLYSDSNMNMDFFEMTKMNVFAMLKMYDDYVLTVCDIVLRNEGVKRLYDYPADFGFDLIINDYLSGPCLSALAHHRFGQPPVVAVTAYHGASTTLSMTGVFQNSALIPNHALDAMEKMSYRERFVNLLANMWEEMLHRCDMISKSNQMLRRYEPSLPDVGEFLRQTKLVLLNANPIIQFTEPLMPNIIPVGGLQIVKTKPLPEDLATLLDRSGPGGVVLFSLGTNVRSDQLGVVRINGILDAIRDGGAGGGD
ncbi:UDP-glucosyltransferase 2-like [Anopheles bellator]|uniref:UDP-glucosyltransferase 2-like n=1 Tax=Anopheles bellator TaxID=139047 RepID=UPI002649FB34|nr:UDP-glucosyltransferase 2-like [Anopheles bellator]